MLYCNVHRPQRSMRITWMTYANRLLAEMLFGESDPILIVIEASREMLEIGSVETATPLQFTDIESGVYLIHRYCEISLEIHDHLRQTPCQ